MLLDLESTRRTAISKKSSLLSLEMPMGDLWREMDGSDSIIHPATFSDPTVGAYLDRANLLRYHGRYIGRSVTHHPVRLKRPDDVISVITMIWEGRSASCGTISKASQESASAEGPRPVGTTARTV